MSRQGGLRKAGSHRSLHTSVSSKKVVSTEQSQVGIVTYLVNTSLHSGVSGVERFASRCYNSER